MPGLEISLPGGGSVNSKTGKITPPKAKKLPKPLQETPAQYTARLKKAQAEAKKKPKR